MAWSTCIISRKIVVHGGKGNGVAALQSLREGTTVVVHYTVPDVDETAQEVDRIGDEGLHVIEGVVTPIDRGRKQITIRFDTGKTETLRLPIAPPRKLGTMAIRP